MLFIFSYFSWLRWFNQGTFISKSSVNHVSAEQYI